MRTEKNLGLVFAVLIGGAIGVVPLLSALARTEDGAGAAAESARAYIEASEHAFAASVATGNTETVERILADNLMGLDWTGKPFDKAGMIDQIREAPKTYAGDRINAMKIHVDGDTAIAQGDETIELHEGAQKQVRLVFTDTWLRRSGKWQVVASHLTSATE